MEKFLIDRDKLELVLKYLGTRPYVEVMEVVPAIQTAKLFKPEEAPAVVPEVVNADKE